MIGAGGGGLATAVAASKMGMEVTLVEEGYLGGSKLNYSCIPHNAVLQCVRAADQVCILAPFGVKPGIWHVSRGSNKEAGGRVRSVKTSGSLVV